MSGETRHGVHDHGTHEGFAELTTWRWSRLTCPCGATFQWEGFDERLRPWKAAHRPHLAENPAEKARK